MIKNLRQITRLVLQTHRLQQYSMSSIADLYEHQLQ